MLNKPPVFEPLKVYCIIVLSRWPFVRLIVHQAVRQFLRQFCVKPFLSLGGGIVRGLHVSLLTCYGEDNSHNYDVC